MSGASQVGSPVEDRTAPPTAPLVSHGSIGSMTSIGSLGSVGSTAPLTADVTVSDSHHQLQRRDSQGIQGIHTSFLQFPGINMTTMLECTIKFDI